MLNKERPPKVILQANGSELVCSGNWVTTQISAIAKEFKYLKYATAAKAVVKAEEILTMDTAGAWMLADLIDALKAVEKHVKLTGLNEEYNKLYSFVTEEKSHVVTPPPPEHHSVLYKLGEFVFNKVAQLEDFLAFCGELVIEFLTVLRHPKQIQFKSFVNVLDSAGFQALPIIGLLLFLIGVVLGYEIGNQLKVYGASVYIVALMGIAILQEFAPLIAAIIIAGRTGAAFTSQLGSMKVNQEIDALRTMGLSPMAMLVIPRFLGLLVALPLLTVWADLFGLFGAMVMAKHSFGFSYYSFINRLPLDVKPANYIIGLCKAPVFAAVIAAVGCFQGFEVKMSAESVGQQTTKSVVQAIFLIIIIDAAFSIVFGW